MFSARSADLPGIHSHFKENRQAFNPKIKGRESRWISVEFKANLASKSSSRTAGVVTEESGGGGVMEVYRSLSFLASLATPKRELK